MCVCRNGIAVQEEPEFVPLTYKVLRNSVRLEQLALALRLLLYALVLLLWRQSNAMPGDTEQHTIGECLCFCLYVYKYNLEHKSKCYCCKRVIIISMT